MGLGDPVFRETPLTPHARHEDSWEEVGVGERHPDAGVGPPLGVIRHQLRPVRHLVEVLVDDVRLVDGVPVHDDHWDLTSGAGVEELLALVREIHLMNVKGYPLLVQDHPGPPGVGSTLRVVEPDVHRSPPGIAVTYGDGSTPSAVTVIRLPPSG